MTPNYLSMSFWQSNGYGWCQSQSMNLARAVIICLHTLQLSFGINDSSLKKSSQNFRVLVIFSSHLIELVQLPLELLDSFVLEAHFFLYFFNSHMIILPVCSVLSSDLCASDELVKPSVFPCTSLLLTTYLRPLWCCQTYDEILAKHSFWCFFSLYISPLWLQVHRQPFLADTQAPRCWLLKTSILQLSYRRW